MRNVEYTILRTTEQLHAFAPAWSALWQEDPHATPFQSPDWLLPWWHSFGQSNLRAVTISQNGVLLGFLPFYLYRDPHTGERQLLLLGVGTTDYLNGIFRPACAPEHIQGALDLLCTEDEWDVLYASQLLPHSRLAQAFKRSAISSGEASTVDAFETESCSRMAAVPMAALPQKIRRNAMYYRGRAMRLGAVEFTVANAQNWAESFDALQQLHTSQWQQRGEPGALADRRVLAWHREALPQLQRSGTLRLCSLRLSGEIISVLYSLIDPPSRSSRTQSQTQSRTQYVYLTAYSTKHADLRPGTLLLASTIENAAHEGVRTIDMLRGNEPYKQIWHFERFPTCGFALHRSASHTNSIHTVGAVA